MLPSGRALFGQMDEAVFGKPAADAITLQVQRLGTTRVFLMVSNTLNRKTDEIDKISRVLANRYAGTFDRMPAHTPRAAVIEATEAARAAQADLIVTIGGGSITDGGKAVQMCLANDIRSPEAIDKLRPVKGADGIVVPPMNTPTVRQISVPTTLSAGDFSALAGVTDERTKVKELLRHPRIMPSAVVLDPAITLHTPEWLWLSTGIRAVDHCVEGVCSNEAHVFGDAQALKGLALLASGLPPPTRTWPRGWIAYWAHGCRWVRSLAECRWARAMASAMCWALNSAYRMGTPLASSSRRSCVGTSRQTDIVKR